EPTGQGRVRHRLAALDEAVDRAHVVLDRGRMPTRIVTHAYQDTAHPQVEDHSPPATRPTQRTRPRTQGRPARRSGAHRPSGHHRYLIQPSTGLPPSEA